MDPVSFPSNFPRDLYHYLFRFHQPEAWCVYAQVCKLWNKYASDDALWRPLIQPFCPDFDRGDATWKQVYFNQSRWLRLRSIQITPQKIFAAWGRTIRIWHKTKGSVAINPVFPRGLISCFAVTYAPDKYHLLIGSTDAKVMVLTLPHLTPRVSLKGHQGPITAMRVLGNEQVVTGSTDHKLILWKNIFAENFIVTSETFEGHQAEVTCLQKDFAQPSLRFFSGDAAGVVKVWEVLHDRFILAATLKGHKGRITAMTHSLQKELLFTASTDKTIRIWQRSFVVNWTPIQEILVATPVTSFDYYGIHDRLYTVAGNRLEEWQENPEWVKKGLQCELEEKIYGFRLGFYLNQQHQKMAYLILKDRIKCICLEEEGFDTSKREYIL